MDDLGGADGVEFWRAEARRWRAEATELAGYRAEAQRLTADNLVLRAQVADLQAQVDALVEKVSVPAKLAFGTSSEKASTRATASEDSATTPAGGLGAAPAGQAWSWAAAGLTWAWPPGLFPPADVSGLAIRRSTGRAL